MEILQAIRSRLICLVVGHQWSGWQVPDPDNPGEQIRVCARCSSTKTNAAAVPFPWWADPPQ